MYRTDGKDSVVFWITAAQPDRFTSSEGFSTGFTLEEGDSDANLRDITECNMSACRSSIGPGFTLGEVGGVKNVDGSESVTGVMTWSTDDYGAQNIGVR
jgi:hypothetical protein